MELRSFVVGIQYKEGAPRKDADVIALMGEHNLLEDPFRPDHFRGDSPLTPSELVTSLQSALAERNIEAFAAAEVLRAPQPFADQTRLF